MSNTGMLHLGAAVLALILGPFIFLGIKGTRTHIVMGWVYVAAMLALNGSALFLYTLTGSVSLFHLLIPLSLITLTYGMVAVYFKRPADQWLSNHYRAMSWSYIGLLAAAVAESFVRLPFLKNIRLFGGWIDFALLVGGLCFVVCAVGGYMVAKYESTVLKRLAPVGV